SRRRHTRFSRDWSSDVCSSDLLVVAGAPACRRLRAGALELQTEYLLLADPTADLFLNIIEQPGGAIHLAWIFDPARLDDGETARSEERRVGKECIYRWGRQQHN